jgi:antitoxin ParD1/3/4
MAKNTSVTLGDHYEKFIASQISQGHFGSTSEAIRAGLRLLEEREARLSILRRALVEGEESGTAEYSLEGLLAELDGQGAN